MFSQWFQYLGVFLYANTIYCISFVSKFIKDRTVIYLKRMEPGGAILLLKLTNQTN